MIQHFLSIIICTRNRANELNTSLELVVQQAQEFDDVEVLVVDNGSTDNTKIVVKNISKKFNFSVHYIWEPTIGLSQARNRGRAESQGKVLAYIDDDVRLKNGWIAQVRQHFIEKRSDCLGGKVSVCLEGEVPINQSRE